MPTPLEKARMNPGSVKARILDVARKLFGQYGFHGTTTRMIAKEVGIDISTLHYHWGDKSDLFEGVMQDINDKTKEKLIQVEKKVKGLPLPTRVEIAIQELTDFLFENPDISNNAIFTYFTRTVSDLGLNTVNGKIPEYITNIAYSMGLIESREDSSNEALMKVIAMMNSVYNFVSGEAYFRSIVDVDHGEYVKLTKDTLKFFNKAPFENLK